MIVAMEAPVTRKALALLIGLLVLLTAAGEAAGDTPIRLVRGAVCSTPGGATLTLDVGSVVLEPDHWVALDEALKKSQDAETRLVAENQALREAVEHPSIGWRGVAVLVVAVTAGIGLGWQFR